MFSFNDASPPEEKKEKRRSLLWDLFLRSKGDTQSQEEMSDESTSTLDDPSKEGEEQPPQEVAPFVHDPDALEGYLLESAVRELGLLADEAPLTYAFFAPDSQPLTEEQKALVDTVEAALQKEVEETPAPEAVTMRFFTMISDDAMEAWGIMLPPSGGGSVFDEETLRLKLEAENIRFGADIPGILEAIHQEKWYRLLPLAKGKETRDGVDGKIVEHFSRGVQIRLSEDEQHNIDYKNLNWVQKAEAGDVICDIIPPVPGEDGMTVLGKALKAQAAKTPKVPAGKNTVLSEDGSTLTATSEGQVRYEKGLFHVERSVKINGNVDNSVGNLNVVGDVVVGGNVGDSFSIIATGNIIVGGLVEGAFLQAGGDIQVGLGMKGNLKGTLEAKGNVRSKYLENCTVKAGGNVVADSIINSKVSSGDSIQVLSGHGVIIGGQTWALKTIQAKTIGNESNRMTMISVGSDGLQEDSISKLKKDVEDVKHSIASMEKDVSYLESAGELTVEYSNLLSNLKLKLSVERMTLAKKTKALQAKLAEVKTFESFIVANVMHPSTSINIDGLKLFTNTVSHRCRVYKDKEKDEIVIGSA